MEHFPIPQPKVWLRALAKKGVEVEIVHWLNNLLSNRVAVMQLGRERVDREVEDGAAQGGASPLRSSTRLEQKVWKQYQTCQDKKYMYLWMTSTLLHQVMMNLN